MPYPASRSRTGPSRPGDGQRMSDFVYGEVLRAILDHGYRPGERLSIPDIARSLDVSQMPVRQAIDRLSEEGLVDIRPRSGTFVTQADEREVAETFDIRRALDRLAAETAVLNVCAQDLEELEGLVRHMDRCATRGTAGMASHDRANWEFHLLIVRLSANEKLYEMYQQLNAHLQIASIHVSSRDWASRVPIAQAEHRAMVEALRERSARDLAAALAAHVDRAKLALIGDIRAVRESSAPTALQGLDKQGASPIAPEQAVAPVGVRRRG